MKKILFLAFAILMLASCHKEATITGNWQRVGSDTTYMIQAQVCYQTPDDAPGWNCYNYRLNDETMDVDFAVPEVWYLQFEGNDKCTVRSTVGDSNTYTMTLKRL